MRKRIAAAPKLREPAMKARQICPVGAEKSRNVAQTGSN
jgi:hypothetical protein